MAKVIDFGIAKALNRGTEETRAGLLKGKLRYMSPEQANRGKIDRRADVWSMGAVLYCLMNGAPPYGESGDVQIIARLVKGIGPEALPASVPAVVRGIVEKAMASPEPPMSTRRWTKMAIIGGGLFLGAGAFLLVRGGTKGEVGDPHAAAAPEAPSVAPLTPSASTAPPEALAPSVDPVRSPRPRAPVYARPKPRQKR